MELIYKQLLLLLFIKIDIRLEISLNQKNSFSLTLLGKFFFFKSKKPKYLSSSVTSSLFSSTTSSYLLNNLLILISYVLLFDSLLLVSFTIIRFHVSNLISYQNHLCLNLSLVLLLDLLLSFLSFLSLAHISLLPTISLFKSLI